MEHICVDPLQIISAEVIIAIAGGTHEAGCADFILLHGPENLRLIVLCHLVNDSKAILQSCNGFLTVGIHRGRNTHGLIQFQ